MLFIGISAIVALGLLLPRKLGKAISLCLLLMALGGLSVAGYQCLMQEFPGAVSTYGYADPTLIERIVDWAGMQSPFLFLATGYCEHKDIAFLGLSSVPTAGRYSYVPFRTCSLPTWIHRFGVVRMSTKMRTAPIVA